MTDIAELGFRVDTSGLKDGSRELDQFKGKAKEVEDQVKKTEDATKNAGDGSKKLGTDAKSAGDGLEGMSRASKGVIASLEQQIAKTQMTSAEMRVYQALTKANTTLDTESGRAIAARALALDATVTRQRAATVSTSDLGRSLSALFPTLTTTAAASAALAAEKEKLAVSSLSARNAIRALRPVAEEAGVSLQQLGIFAGAARVGVAGLAVGVAGALVTALENAADKARVLKGRLSDLGLGETGATKAIDAIEQSSKRSGTSVSALAKSVEDIIKLQERAGDGSSNIVSRYVPNATGEPVTRTANLQQAVAASQTLFNLIKAGGGDVAAASTAINGFISSIGKIAPETGKAAGLTHAAFEQLRTDSPRAAAELQKALGKASISAQEFMRELDHTPVSVQTLLRALAQIGPAAQAEADKVKDTLPQAWDRVKAAWERLGTALGNSAGMTVASDALDALATKIASPEWERSFNSLKGYATDFSQTTVQEWNALSRAIEETTGWVKRHGLAYGGLASDAAPGLNAFEVAVRSAFSRAVEAAVAGVNAIIAAVKNGLGAISQLGNAGPIGSPQRNAVNQQLDNAPSAQSNMTAINGQIVNVPPADNNMPSTGGVPFLNNPFFPPSTDTSGGFADSVQQFGPFATGGDFTVGGSGGTDSQTVTFKATPGETVTVTPPGGEAGESTPRARNMGDAPQVRAADIAAAIRQSTIRIIGAIGDQTEALTRKIGVADDDIVAAIRLLQQNNAAISVPLTATGAPGGLPAPTPTPTPTPDVGPSPIPSSQPASNIGSSGTAPTSSPTSGGGGGVKFPPAGDPNNFLGNGQDFLNNGLYKALLAEQTQSQLLADKQNAYIQSFQQAFNKAVAAKKPAASSGGVATGRGVVSNPFTGSSYGSAYDFLPNLYGSATSGISYLAPIKAAAAASGARSVSVNGTGSGVRSATNIYTDPFGLNGIGSGDIFNTPQSPVPYWNNPFSGPNSIGDIYNPFASEPPEGTVEIGPLEITGGDSGGGGDGGGGGAFADGGQFTVKGRGGIDKVPVHFLATRGERVTISTTPESRAEVERAKRTAKRQSGVAAFIARSKTPTGTGDTPSPARSVPSTAPVGQITNTSGPTGFDDGTPASPAPSYARNTTPISQGGPGQSYRFADGGYPPSAPATPTASPAVDSSTPPAPGMVWRPAGISGGAWVPAGGDERFMGAFAWGGSFIAGGSSAPADTPMRDTTPLSQGGPGQSWGGGAFTRSAAPIAGSGAGSFSSAFLPSAQPDAAPAQSAPASGMASEVKSLTDRNTINFHVHGVHTPQIFTRSQATMKRALRGMAAG